VREREWSEDQDARLEQNSRGAALDAEEITLPPIEMNNCACLARI
jgi:hypothetical protein